MKKATFFHSYIFVFLSFSSIVVASVASAKNSHQNPDSHAAQSISGSDILEHIKTLASDEFEGRSPGTKGESMSVQYLIQEFKKIGLSPGNTDGTYIQKVPLVGITTQPSLQIQSGEKQWSLKFPEDFVAFSPQTDPDFEIKKSELVFVGYGVVAPEYQWDDYKGADLKGKTILMLVNDPAIPDPRNPDKLDPNMFKGEAMTYYGRWTYKYEMAIKMGAAAAIIIHETKPAAYPYEVVINSWGRENFGIRSKFPSTDFPSVASWIQNDRAKELFKACGLDFDSLKKAALSRDFKPINLNASAHFQIKNTSKEVDSANVVGMIEGSDSKLKNQYIIYSAHWDHFGLNEKLPGPKTNQIFHGATDNASGVATLIAVAKAFKNLPHPPKRSILFLATTAEERGLLGARYYARNPIYPLKNTLADINIDVMNLWGRTNDFEITGIGKSTIDDLVIKLTASQKRKVTGEARPEHGSFYRGDQFEFAKVGVPVLYSTGGSHFIGKPESYAREKVDDFVAHNYHKVSDIVRPDWDFSGAVEDAQILFLTGNELSKTKDFPKWKKSSEFQFKP